MGLSTERLGFKPSPDYIRFIYFVSMCTPSKLNYDSDTGSGEMVRERAGNPLICQG